MWDWARRRPRRCLKIGADAVAWAEAGRTWRGSSRSRCALSPLPEGAVKPSPAEPNVSDPAMVETRIRSLAGPAPGLRFGERVWVEELPRPIVLLLPDAAVRAVVLQLDQLPPRPDEREALIRWRLGQEQLFPLAGAKVAYQVFDGAEADAARTVFAVAIQESVLGQYESLCESAGLIPLDVSVTSVQLFELWRRAAGRSAWRRRDFLWVNVADRALTTMVFQRGRLLFYRCKLLPGEATSVVPETEMLNKIIEECGASLDVCQQRYPRALVKEAVICADGDLSALQAKVEAGLDLSVEQVGWGALQALGWGAAKSHRSMAAMAAMAGVA